MHTGHYISGAGLGILILWLLFGGLFEAALLRKPLAAPHA